MIKYGVHSMTPCWWYQHQNCLIVSHTFVVPSLFTLMLKSWQGVQNVIKDRLSSVNGGIQAL